MKFTKQELQKIYDNLNKRQTISIIALLIMPGGVPVLLWYFYKKYHHLLQDFEIVIQRKNKED